MSDVQADRQRSDGRIFLGPQQPAELERAITRAGGHLSSAADAEAVVWYGGKPPQLPEHLSPRTRWVQLPAAGVEPWLAAGVLPDDVVVTSAAGAYATTVAEHVLALLLAGTRRLHELARARTWSSPSPSTLRGATVVIVGAGGIGSALIDLLGPLGARVVAVTRSGRDVEGAVTSVASDRLHDVLPEADHVVVLAPATEETTHLIGAAELDLVPPTCRLVNVARGSLVDTDALLTALRERRLAGAALDVTDPEPLPDGHPLWEEPDVLITPHSANPKPLLLPRLAERVEDNVRRFLAGEELIGVVDRSRGY